jgi:hypothetical protein
MMASNSAASRKTKNAAYEILFGGSAEATDNTAPFRVNPDQARTRSASAQLRAPERPFRRVPKQFLRQQYMTKTPEAISTVNRFVPFKTTGS